MADDLRINFLNLSYTGSTFNASIKTRHYLMCKIRRSVKEIRFHHGYSYSKKYKDFQKTEWFQEFIHSPEKQESFQKTLWEAMSIRTFYDYGIDHDCYLHGKKARPANRKYLQTVFVFIFRFEGQEYYFKFFIQKGVMYVKSFHINEPQNW